MTQTLDEAVQLGEYGGPDTLHIVELPIPVAGPGEVVPDQAL